MKTLFFAFIFIPLISMAGPGFGVVTILRGQVEAITASGEKRALKVGDKVFESETIVTQKMSAVRLAMMDTNVIEIYPNSNMKIQQYVYNPKEDQKNVSLEVNQGRIKSSVKQKYDNDKNKYNVKTPVIVAGVRGTTFSAEHESKSNLSRVVTFEGNVLVGKRGADDTVKEFFAVMANQSINIDSKGSSKPEVKEVPRVEQEKIKKEDKKEGFERPVAIAPEERAKVAEKNGPAKSVDSGSPRPGAKNNGAAAPTQDELRARLEEQKNTLNRDLVRPPAVIAPGVRPPIPSTPPAAPAPAPAPAPTTGTIGTTPGTVTNPFPGFCAGGATPVNGVCP